MAKCPKCNADIDHLEAIASERTTYVVRFPVDEEEKGLYDCDVETGLLWIVNTVEGEQRSFVCPVCTRELTKDGEEAAKILKGGE